MRRIVSGLAVTLVTLAAVLVGGTPAQADWLDDLLGIDDDVRNADNPWAAFGAWWDGQLNPSLDCTSSPPGSPELAMCEYFDEQDGVVDGSADGFARMGIAASGLNASGAVGASAGRAGITAAQQAGIDLAGLLGITSVGIGAYQLLNDDTVSPLPLSPGSPGGWANGDQSVTSMTFDLPSGGPVFASTVTSTYQIAIEQHSGCSQADQVAFRDCWAAFYGNANFGVSITNVMSDGSVAGSNSVSWVNFWSSADKSRVVVTSSSAGTVARPFDHIRLGTGVYAQTNILRWYPEGHALYPPPSAGGLVGHLEQDLTCTGPSGSTVVSQVVNVTGNITDVPSLSCPTGTVPTAWSSRYVDDLTGDTSDLWSGSADSIVTEVPDCIGNSACAIELWQVFANAPAQYCGSYGIGCPDWWRTVQTTPSAYECRYGTTVVDLSYCAIYRNPGNISPTVPVSVNEDGEVVVGQRIDTVDDEDYKPFYTPNPSPNPSGTPTPDPTTDPTTDPTPDPDPSDDPEPGPSNQYNRCWPEGWTWNPLDWVLTPLACAFVPSKGFPTAKVQDALVDSPIGTVTATLDGIRISFGDLVGDGECGVLASSDGITTFGAPVDVTTCNVITEQLRPIIRFMLYALFIVSGIFVAFTAVALGFDIQAINLRGSKGDGS